MEYHQAIAELAALGAPVRELLRTHSITAYLPARKPHHARFWGRMRVAVFLVEDTERWAPPLEPELPAAAGLTNEPFRPEGMRPLTGGAA